MRLLTLIGLLLNLFGLSVGDSAKQRNSEFKSILIRGRLNRDHKGVQQLFKTKNSTWFRDAVAASFTQQLDHLGREPGDTFQQRYWYNAKWYRPGGPVFLMLDGEWCADPMEGTDHEWMEAAQKAGAWAFLLEHRFYGETQPTPDLSTKNLRFLSSKQAIEDAASFIRGMVEKFPELSGAKWVSFGCSYAGALTAWLRIKQPQLVDYAVGSSGPVQAELDFAGYLEMVMTAINDTDSACADSVSQGFNLISQLLQNAKGRAILKSTFTLCNDLDVTNTLNINAFWEQLYEAYMANVQFSGSNPLKNISSEICRFHNDKSLSILDRVKHVVSHFNERFGNRGCMPNNYQAMVEQYNNTSYNFARAWIWQTCNEFGYFQTTNSTTAGPFWGGQNNWPVSYYVQMCADLFGKQYTRDYIQQQVNRTNENYGGWDMNGASYIILPNGGYDPWSMLGKEFSSNPTIIPVVIKGASHCQDMFGSTSWDSEELKSARKRILFTLLEWLEETSFFENLIRK